MAEAFSSAIFFFAPFRALAGRAVALGVELANSIALYKMLIYAFWQEGRTMGQIWKCTVCGYREDGTEAPPRCPRCGAAEGRFIPLERGSFNLPRDLADSFILHAVAAHFPNGLIPAAVLFLFLCFLSRSLRFEETAYLLLLLVLVVIPLSLASGIYDWRKRYGGVRAGIFYKKIVLAVLLFILTSGAAGLRYLHPEIFHQDHPLQTVYLSLVGLAFVVSVLLGHYGGKLAFQWRNRKW
jgi:uncharacterized membrane protein